MRNQRSFGQEFKRQVVEELLYIDRDKELSRWSLRSVSVKSMGCSPLSWISYRRSMTLRQLTPDQIGLQGQRRDH